MNAAVNGFNTWYQAPASGTNLIQVLPFTPTAKYSQTWTFQANDPLVHYTVGDLNDTSPPCKGSTNSIVPPNNTTLTTSNTPLPNIGQINTRYHPWNYYRNQSTDPGFNNLAIKDPLITQSDDWDFPTNKYPNVGWLGRVHRGTPWQTVYLKSTAITNSRLGAVDGQHQPCGFHRFPADERLEASRPVHRCPERQRGPWPAIR